MFFVTVKVKDYSQSGQDLHLGSVAARVLDLEQGYRRAYLENLAGKLLRPASLFLRIEREIIQKRELKKIFDIKTI